MGLAYRAFPMIVHTACTLAETGDASDFAIVETYVRVYRSTGYILYRRGSGEQTCAPDATSRRFRLLVPFVRIIIRVVLKGHASEGAVCSRLNQRIQHVVYTSQP